MTSFITLIEVLVHPLRVGRPELAEDYRNILLQSPVLTAIPIDEEISEEAARLRARHNLRTARCDPARDSHPLRRVVVPYERHGFGKSAWDLGPRPAAVAIDRCPPNLRSMGLASPFAKIPAMADANVYPPSAEFVNHANVKGMEGYRALYQKAAEKPEEFWGELAENELHWFEKWSHVFEWNPPFAKWFVGGKTNVSYNCVDRHLTTHRKNKVAILWEGEPGDQRHDHLPGTAPPGVPLRQRAEGARPTRPATAPSSTWGWCRSCRSRCWRARGWASSTAWCSADSRAEALKARIQDLEAQVVITARWRLAARQGSAAEGCGGRSARRMPERARRDRLPAHRRRHRRCRRAAITGGTISMPA